MPLTFDTVFSRRAARAGFLARTSMPMLVGIRTSPTRSPATSRKLTVTLTPSATPSPHLSRATLAQIGMEMIVARFATTVSTRLSAVLPPAR